MLRSKKAAGGERNLHQCHAVIIGGKSKTKKNRWGCKQLIPPFGSYFIIHTSCQLAPPSSDNPHRCFLKKEREFVHAFLLYKGPKKKRDAKKAVPFHHTLLSLRVACCPRSSTGCFCLCFPNLHSSCQVLFCASKSPFPERLLGYWGPCPIEARKLTHACLNIRCCLQPDFSSS